MAQRPVRSCASVLSLSHTRRTMPSIWARHESSVTSVFTKESYSPLGHYSQATKANGTIYLAGQIAADNSGNLLEGSIAEKAHQILRNSEAILKEAGSGLDRVAKVTVYVTSMGLLPEFNAVYNTYFPHKPARTSMAVTGLPLGVDIEVDIVAVE